MNSAVIPLWKQILRNNVTNLSELVEILELSDEQKSFLLEKPKFALNIPRRLVDKMSKGTLDDPIFRQFVPLQKEQVSRLSFIKDPIGDCLSRKAPKLLHKYQGRVLLVCTSACAMHCRYCFRQHFDYDVSNKIFEEELEVIRNDSSIHEVILSGGDPLSLDNRILSALISQISSIPHIKKVRFHSRFPVGIPERIDDSFLEILSTTPLQFVFVVHVNHSRELDKEVLTALKKLQCLGIPVLNQSVLLKGVNDSLEALMALSEKLTDHGIMPYYLHQLDRVEGASHFEVEEQKGKQLIAELGKCLPGYAVPRYVREIAGEPGKTPL